MLLTGLLWGSSEQRICLRHGWLSQQMEIFLTFMKGNTELRLGMTLVFQILCISRRMIWMGYILLPLLRKKIQVCSCDSELLLFNVKVVYPSFAAGGELRWLCPVILRWLWVPRNPERCGQRQHQQPRAEHRLDRPRWLPSGYSLETVYTQ